jgi:hypothetical protein
VRRADAAAAAGTSAEFAAPPIDAYVPPGQSRVFSLPQPKGGALDQITLRGDDEVFDNTVHFIPPAQQKSSVLWIGTDAAEDTRQPLFFLRRGFSDTPRVAVQVIVRTPTTALLPEEVKAASLIFVQDALSAEAATALREQALAGKTIVFVPKSGSAAPTLAALLGRDAVRVDEARPSNYAMLAEINFQHPLFAPFADPRFSDFTKIHVWKYRKIDLSNVPDARAIVKFDSGDPAIAEVPVGKGKVYILATGWHPDDSQLAVSSKFVPLMWSLLELAGGAGTFVTQFSVGESVPLAGEGAATAVRTPEGTSVNLEPKAADFAQTLAPGVYELSGGPRPQRFAVNLDPNESRTVPLGTDELEQLGLPVARTKAATETAVENKTFLQGIEAENRQKLWRWFIAATLAVLLFESALAGWTARRSALQTEEVAS